MMPVDDLLPSLTHDSMKRLVTIFALLLLIAKRSNCQDECLGKCVKKDMCKAEKSTDVFVLPVVTDPSLGIDLRFNAGCDSLETCCKDAEIIPSAPRQEVQFEQCGIRNENGIGYRLVGNKVGSAQYGEFPWTLMVLKDQVLFDLKKEIYVCAASLIAPDLALTTAHCVSEHKTTKYLVRAGEWDTSSFQELFSTQTREVSQVIVHEKYNEYHHNNIALLKMDKAFKADQNIQTICLPSPQLRVVDGQECFTGAWGKDKFEQGHTQNILRRIEVPIVPHARCQDALKSTRLGPFFILDESYMCAGGEENVDACTGDGGAPLACAADDSRYFQAGIVAWGIGCGQKNIPGAYTDVSKFLDWILNKMESLGSDINASKY